MELIEKGEEMTKENAKEMMDCLDKFYDICTHNPDEDCKGCPMNELDCCTKVLKALMECKQNEQV